MYEVHFPVGVGAVCRAAADALVHAPDPMVRCERRRDCRHATRKISKSSKKKRQWVPFTQKSALGSRKRWVHEQLHDACSPQHCSTVLPWNVRLVGQ